MFDQGASSYTYYYSLTDNLVTGTLNFNGTIEEVSGSAWIDRQYGSFDPNTREKYEWFFLQLSNGMDLNIWNLFTPENLLPEQEAYRHLSVYVDENTQGKGVKVGLITTEGYRYSGGVRLRGYACVEVTLPFYFFEGAVSVSGTVKGEAVTGKGFAELLKSYEAPQLSILSPQEPWNKAEPITWMVENPDQGRPLLFDLAYSTDQGDTWLPVVVELRDTFYYWNDTPLMDGDSCLFQVTAYTADRTLEGVFVSPKHSVYVDQTTLAGGKSVPGLQLYPNPVAQSLGIQWEKDPAASGKISYLIMDYSGRELLSGFLSDNSIDVSPLIRGLYLIMLETPGESFVKTFVKH